MKCLEKDAESIRLLAKKEVFDDIEKSDLFKEHISKTEWWEELKKEHLHPIPDTATKGSI